MRLDADSIPRATVAQIEAALAGAGAGRRVIALLERDRRAGVRLLAMRERRRYRARMAENRRRRRMRDLEERYWQEGPLRVAGVDEVGRGCLAGPVVAAAVVLPPEAARAGELFDLDDSKVLDAGTRARLRDEILALALSWAVAPVAAEVIDRINILEASMEAMRMAISGLDPTPDRVLVDGARAPGSGLPETAVIDGDARSLSIAAASVVAKEHRDRMMEELHRRFPEYGFDTNKGYASTAHREALARHGPCPLHRRTFSPLAQREQLSLDLGPDTGRDGETVAADYLRDKGYRVLHRRYRAAGGEIDLIAADGDCCVFVEVKSTDRASDRPEDRVRRDKRRKLIRCARQFVERSAAPGTEYRFDVVAVDLSARTPAVEHMEDAFDSGA